MKLEQNVSNGAMRKPTVLQFHPAIAQNREIGLNGAIFIHQVHYWTSQNMKKERGLYNGRYWVYNSVENWRKNNFPFWNCSTIKRIIERLEKLGILLTTVHNKRGYDRTKSYAIDYNRLYELTGIAYFETYEAADGKQTDVEFKN